MSDVNHYYVLDSVWQENKRACLCKKKKQALSIYFTEQQHYILHPVHSLKFLFNPFLALSLFCFWCVQILFVSNQISDLHL